MKIKDYIIEVEKRLDQKCSWGAKEVKLLLKDVVIEMYEREEGKGVSNDKGQREDRSDNQTMATSSDGDVKTPVGHDMAQTL